MVLWICETYIELYRLSKFLALAGGPTDRRKAVFEKVLADLKTHIGKRHKYPLSVTDLRTQRIYTGGKSYKYNQCDFKSSCSDILRKHLKTHTGEKSNIYN